MRPLPRIKFIWGAGRVIRGRWYLGLFGFYDRVEGEPDSGLAFSLRGALAWGAALGALAYVGTATALHAVWTRNPYNELTRADALLYPFRRGMIAEKKGRAFIAQGQAYFLEKKFQDAASLLRHGLARHPADPEARITLAQIHTLANQRSLALAVLEEGLGVMAYPGRRYLEALVAAATAADDHARIVEVAARFLAPGAPAGAKGDERWFRERKFAALLALGRHEEALALGRGTGMTPLGVEQQVLALLELKRAGEALTMLTDAAAVAAAEPALVARLKVRVWREAGRMAEMDAALAQLRALGPADPSPLVYAVVQRMLAGQAAAAEAALEDFVFRFGGNAEHLVLLAEPLAELNAESLLVRILAAARERGHPLARLQSLLLQVQAMRGDWGAAGRTLAGIAVPPREPLAATLWREWMARLIEAGRTQSDAAQLALLDFLRTRPWPVAVFRQTVTALKSGGREAAVRDVIGLAARIFPASAWVRDEAARLAEAQAGPALARRRAVPDPEVLEEPTFWAQVERLQAQRQWGPLDEWIRAAMSARPAPVWLTRRDPDLRLVQISVALGLQDKPALITAARMYLNGDEHRAQHVLVLAERAAGEGATDLARTLLREVNRRSPELTEAAALLRRLPGPE